MKTVYISFSAEINAQTCEQLLAATFKVIENGCDHIYYLFSTPGGIVSNGIHVYNTLKGLQTNITMHNVGNVDSIGNAIFLAGKNRIACQHSTFMFHGVGLDVENVRLEEQVLREKLEAIEAEHAKIGGIIADETSLESEEIKGLFRQASTKDADFALRGGIVQAIQDVYIPQGAPVIQLVFQR
ncbi:hypothetical protein JCM15519_17160 [Fundidesulfovibrio butyratiphilus]